MYFCLDLRIAKAILLLNIYLIGLFAPFYTLVNFAIYQEEITDEFCENKDKPKLACNGKCHLSKLLANQPAEEGQELSTFPSLEYPLGKVEPITIKDFILDCSFLRIPPYWGSSTNNLQDQIDHPPWC